MQLSLREHMQSNTKVARVNRCIQTHAHCIQAGVCNGEYTSNSSCQLLYIGHAGSHCIHNCTYYNTSFIDKHYTSCADCYIPNIYNSSGSAVEDYKLVAESALLHLLSARVQVIVSV